MEIHSLDTFFVEKGEGETVLLLHGWGGSNVSMLGLMNKMQDNYRVIALDLWGFGKSQTPNKETTIYDYAVWVVEFLDMLDITKAHIVGHSFGGRIGVILGSMFPEKVKTLTLIDSAGLATKKSKKQKKQEEEYKKLKIEVENGEQDPMVLKKYGSSDYKKLSGDMRDIFVRVVNTDLSKEAMNIQVPTNIIWGKKDTDTPPSMARKFKRYIRGSKLNWLKGGHYAYLMEQDEVVEMCYKFWGIM